MSSPSSSRRLQKLQDKMCKRMGQAVSRFVTRDTLFVASNNPSPTSPTLNTATLMAESERRTSPDMPPLPTYEQAVASSPIYDYTASHLRSQDVGLEMMRSALLRMQNEMEQFEQDTITLDEYAKTLPQQTDDGLRMEIRDMEAELNRLHQMYPTALPPPVPTRPHSTSDTDWMCIRCGERHHEHVPRCRICRLPSLRIPLSESELCGCKYCSGECVESPTDPGWIVPSYLILYERLAQMTSVVDQLIEMGFTKEQAEEASKANTDIQSAMEWIIAKQEGQSTETTGQTVGEKVEEAIVASYKCNDCGKIMKDENVMMFHASKTGHENFSESTETIKPLTEEEKKEQAAKLKERIKASIAAKAEVEKKEAFEKEKKRINEGKLMLEQREKQKEMEQLAAIAERKRAKEEEKAAKERVLEQIRLDKEARKQRALGSSAPPQPTVSTTPAPPVNVEKKNYTETTIQFRLPDGQVIRQKFGANEELAAVHLWVKMNHPDLEPFSLLQPFPRKILSDEDMAAPLSHHGLVPSGSLVVTRSA